MQIWVDADACPKVIKEILFRAAERCKISCTFVANQYIQTPHSSFLKSLVVEQGFDVADRRIVELCTAGDLIITSDIPLASDVIAKGGLVLDSRGERLSRENIGERLNMRDFMDTLRASGIDTGGPSAMSTADRQNFARALDSLLNKAQR
ncbi:MAG: YaiI/YqxD family protein [Proteobacteria bacterium]|nr:YaiI/YqxD family protein [Pseudomonadota bacterium]